MMKKSILILTTMCLGIAPLFAQITIGNTTLTEREVINNLDVPWEIKWGPDDHIWVTERGSYSSQQPPIGFVSRINVENGTKHVVLDLSDVVFDVYESGLLGMEFHPDFNNGSPYVFLAYTYGPNNNPLEKIVAYEYDADNDQLINETVLVDGIDANSTHVGCRLLALEDQTLLITTGDAQQWMESQDPNIITGKTLKISINTQDGSWGQPASDNPDPNSIVYTLGHRNAQGLALGPNGIIYSSEHGPSNDDELNIIEANSNYGWPNVQGFCDNINVDTYYAEDINSNYTETDYCEEYNIVEPLWSSGTSTIAPSDIIWYDHPAIPEFQNSLLMTVLKGKKLVRFKFNMDGQQITEEDDFFVNTWGRLRDICVSPDGKIYLATNGYNWPSQGPNEIIELSNDAYYAASSEELKTKLSIYPNPIKSDELLHLTGLENNQNITITDLSGKVILTQQVYNNSIDIRNIKTGMYIIHCQSFKQKLMVY